MGDIRLIYIFFLLSFVYDKFSDNFDLELNIEKINMKMSWSVTVVYQTSSIEILGSLDFLFRYNYWSEHQKEGITGS